MGKPTFAALHERVKQMGHETVKVGVLSSAGASADGTPLVEIAAVHEFGTSPTAKIQIPERSFIRSTFRRTTNERKKVTARLVKAVMNNDKMDVAKALGLLGQWMAARIKETIVKRLTEGPEDQALKPATIAAKGSTTPLLDTGLMKNSISYAVVKGEQK